MAMRLATSGKTLPPVIVEADQREQAEKQEKCGTGEVPGVRFQVAAGTFPQIDTEPGITEKAERPRKHHGEEKWAYAGLERSRRDNE